MMSFRVYLFSVRRSHFSRQKPPLRVVVKPNRPTGAAQHSHHPDLDPSRPTHSDDSAATLSSCALLFQPPHPRPENSRRAPPLQYRKMFHSVPVHPAAPPVAPPQALCLRLSITRVDRISMCSPATFYHNQSNAVLGSTCVIQGQSKAYLLGGHMREGRANDHKDSTCCSLDEAENRSI